MRKVCCLILLIALCVPVSLRADCTAVVVGKKATLDGAVLFGHNEDDGGRRIVNVWHVPRMRHETGEMIQLVEGGQVPQVAETWALTWFQSNGIRFADYFVNEWGVNVGSDACGSREDQPELTDGGISYMLRRIVAERARTAREGVEIAGELLDTFGYASSGRTYTIADPDEAWLLAVVAGKHWVAQRVPDDAAVVLPNTYVIRQVDFNDRDNFITSSDNVRDYAIKRGWYDPKSGKPFDFAFAYMRQPRTSSTFVERGYDVRQWRGQALLTGHETSIPDAKKSGLPFSVKPNRKIGPHDVMAILRDHHEGTPYGPAEKVLASPDATSDHPGHGVPRRIYVNPNATTERAICTTSTQFSTVAQLRSGQPKEIGCVLWLSFGRPDCNAYIPWYLGAKSVPAGFNNMPGVNGPVEALARQFDAPDGTFDYDPNAVHWIFNDLENLVDAAYPETIGEVIPVWREMEERMFRMQPGVETAAAALLKQSPEQTASYLAGYTQSLTSEALETAKALANRLKGLFYH